MAPLPPLASPTTAASLQTGDLAALKSVLVEEIEHDDLHQELVRATQASGRVGEAAKAVAKVLHSHFVDEEEFALPPLGLLAQVARVEPVPDPDRSIALAQRLKRELPRMLSEHKTIVAALEELVAAARAEERPEFAHFAEKLILTSIHKHHTIRCPARPNKSTLT
jgi:hypothetical protein